MYLHIRVHLDTFVCNHGLIDAVLWVWVVVLNEALLHEVDDGEHLL